MRSSLVRAPVFAATITLVALSACGDGTTPTGASTGPVFVVEVAGEQFRIRVTEAGRVAQARARMGQAGPYGVQGALAAGDGGFNRGYSWHLRPETVTFNEVAIELCDARPSFIEKDLDYWLNTVRSFCPATARIIREE